MWDSEGKTKFFFSLSPAIQVAKREIPSCRGISKQESHSGWGLWGGITLRFEQFACLLMSSDTSFRMVALSSCRTKSSGLFLHVRFKQCAPVLGDELATAATVKSGRRFLDWVLKIWVALKTPWSPTFLSPLGTRAHCQGCDVIPIGAHIKEVFAVVGSAVCHGTLPYLE